MSNAFISFYLKANKIHIFVDMLRAIGSPNRICFFIDQSGKKLLVVPYKDKDFRSHKVPDSVYSGSGHLEINSLKLCRSLSQINGWNNECSYRVPGRILQKQNMAEFDLIKAMLIEH